MQKYEVAKHIIRYKQPYGGYNEILNGFTVVNTEIGTHVHRVFQDKDDAKILAYKLSKGLKLPSFKKDADELIIACMMSNNIFSEECNEIKERLDGN